MSDSTKCVFVISHQLGLSQIFGGTVDGRNPAPPGIYKGKPFNWCRISEPSTVGLITAKNFTLRSLRSCVGCRPLRFAAFFYTNIVPEKNPVEKEIPSGNYSFLDVFRGYAIVREKKTAALDDSTLFLSSPEYRR